MSTNCKYCNKPFNNTAALNWHMQKDASCIQRRSKMVSGKTNIKSSKSGAANKSGTTREQFRDVPVVIDPDLNFAAGSPNVIGSKSIGVITNSADEKISAKKVPPPIPPRHNRGSSKTEIDLSSIVSSQQVAIDVVGTNSTADQPSQLMAKQISDLQHTIETLQEANQKLAYENIALMGENTSLKNKIIKQDDELHQWKDKVLSGKQKLVGEDLKNELIGLILDSNLNISSVPDEFEREIYGFIIDKLADRRGLFKRIFSCK
jgi:regulator of replication initiation timing